MARRVEGFDTEFQTMGRLIERIESDERFSIIQGRHDVVYEIPGRNILIGTVTCGKVKGDYHVAVEKFDGHATKESRTLAREGYEQLRSFVGGQNSYFFPTQLEIAK